eukprot:2032668-Alexandrium_andersonii.AAC.1
MLAAQRVRRRAPARPLQQLGQRAGRAREASADRAPAHAILERDIVPVALADRSVLCTMAS